MKTLQFGGVAAQLVLLLAVGSLVAFLSAGMGWLAVGLFVACGLLLAGIGAAAVARLTKG